MNLSDRMKKYEDAYRYYLSPRMPVIIRMDGKAFHTLTKNCDKPFDKEFGLAMDYTAIALLSEVQNSRFAYVQSDEISLLLIDYTRFESQQWFNGNIQKMVSVSASIATVAFNEIWNRGEFKNRAFFDSRVFILPEREVINYFVYRQQDATRNSVQMVAQSLYSHKQLLNKNTNEMQEMIFQAGQNWDKYGAYWKRGRVVTNEMHVEFDTPIFSQDRLYIERFMEIAEE